MSDGIFDSFQIEIAQKLLQHYGLSKRVARSELFLSGLCLNDLNAAQQGVRALQARITNLETFKQMRWQNMVMVVGYLQPFRQLELTEAISLFSKATRTYHQILSKNVVGNLAVTVEIGFDCHTGFYNIHCHAFMESNSYDIYKTETKWFRQGQNPLNRYFDTKCVRKSTDKTQNKRAFQQYIFAYATKFGCFEGDSRIKSRTKRKYRVAEFQLKRKFDYVKLLLDNPPLLRVVYPRFNDQKRQANIAKQTIWLNNLLDTAAKAQRWRWYKSAVASKKQEQIQIQKILDLKLEFELDKHDAWLADLATPSNRFHNSA